MRLRFALWRLMCMRERTRRLTWRSLSCQNNPQSQPHLTSLFVFSLSLSLLIISSIMCVKWKLCCDASCDTTREKLVPFFFRFNDPRARKKRTFGERKRDLERAGGQFNGNLNAVSWRWIDSRVGTGFIHRKAITWCLQLQNCLFQLQSRFFFHRFTYNFSTFLLLPPIKRLWRRQMFLVHDPNGVSVLYVNEYPEAMLLT